MLARIALLIQGTVSQQDLLEKAGRSTKLMKIGSRARFQSGGSSNREKEKMQALEKSLQESLRSKRKEFDEMKVVCDESVSKVSDLERRLENQTNEVLRLTAELESYEYE